MPYSVIAEKCPQNHICPLIDICPVGAISQGGFALPTIDANLCIECGKCRKMCKMEAVNWVAAPKKG